MVSAHLKNISQTWESSPNRDENKKYFMLSCLRTGWEDAARPLFFQTHGSKPKSRAGLDNRSRHEGCPRTTDPSCSSIQLSMTCNLDKGHGTLIAPTKICTTLEKVLHVEVETSNPASFKNCCKHNRQCLTRSRNVYCSTAMPGCNAESYHRCNKLPIG